MREENKHRDPVRLDNSAHANLRRGCPAFPLLFVSSRLLIWSQRNLEKHEEKKKKRHRSVVLLNMRNSNCKIKSKMFWCNCVVWVFTLMWRLKYWLLGVQYYN